MRFGSPKKPSQRSALSSPVIPPSPASPGLDANTEVSPELVPIVTLLSAQTHRRYHEGIFMLYYDLNGDGKPGDREWKEVYGILTGNQLAYWDAANLARFKDSPEKLFETSTKPQYLNFTDAVFNGMTVLPAAKQQLENVIIVSTTLKNRYLLQLRSYDSLKEWFLGLRLANFEHQSLQEAYTGALLSARGSMLSDIRTILGEKRFNHEDWVKIRYGSGSAWKRCYAVIEPSQYKRKKFTPGRVLLYESDTLKKKFLLAVITSATSVTAVYPQSPFFIDKSTIMKLEGSINFSPEKSLKKANVQEISLFLMPEQHSSVPGFDTLIRFLIPLYDAFGLYGRPKRLKADRVDPDSLVFGLPTLPHVHYLNSTDIEGLASSPSCLSWDTAEWRENIKRILKSKMSSGYDGCGSSRGFSGAVSSLNSPQLKGSMINSPSMSSSMNSPSANSHQFSTSAESSSNSYRQISSEMPKTSLPAQKQRAPLAQAPNRGMPDGQSSRHKPPSNLPSGQTPYPENEVHDFRSSTPTSGHRNVNNLEIQVENDNRASVQLADIYQKYSTIVAPSDRFDNRNDLLDGSDEELDEEVLPSLMRKKSLMHGPYPSSDRHLIDSESESESESDDSIQEEKTDLLALPKPYDNRNSSYSSVQSPLTQYNEFNKQFSNAVNEKPPSKLQPNNLDGSDDDTSHGSASPPPVPSHGSSYPRTPTSPKQFPQIQQLNSLHSPQKYESQTPPPSHGEKFSTRPQETTFQKSKATRDLSSGLASPNLNKPRYIQMPGAQANRSREAVNRPEEYRQPNQRIASGPSGQPGRSPVMQQSQFSQPQPQSPQQFSQPPHSQPQNAQQFASSYQPQHKAPPQQVQRPPQQPQQYHKPPPQQIQASAQQTLQGPPQPRPPKENRRPSGAPLQNPPIQGQRNFQPNPYPTQNFPQGQAPGPVPAQVQGQVPGQVPGQRPQHAYSARVVSPTSGGIPPRPVVSASQSASSIRSYGDQQYQYQVQQKPPAQQYQQPQQYAQHPQQHQQQHPHPQQQNPQQQQQHQQQKGYMYHH